MELAGRRHNSGGSGNVGERRCSSNIRGKYRRSSGDNCNGRLSNINERDNGYPEKTK